VSSAPLPEEPGRKPNWFEARLYKITGSATYTPLALLFLLWLWDQFDTAAFSVLAPEIKQAFGFSDRTFLALVVGNTILLIILAVPLGYIGDRYRRVLLSVIGAVIAGVFSLMTAVATTAVLFVVMRVGNGIGQLVNGPVHTSLLADIYSPHARPQVFSMHRNAEYVGAILGGVVAGTLGLWFGWRAAFVLLAIPILVTAYFALRRIPEPRRGATDHPELAGQGLAPRAPSFVRSCSILFAVPTLRRVFLTWAFLGAAYIPLGVYRPLFYDRVFFLNSGMRGLLAAANGVAILLGVYQSGKWTQAWIRRGAGEPVARAGIALALTGVAVLAFAASPWLWLNVAVGLVGGFIFGVVTPAAITSQAMISPARVRTFSFALAPLFATAGAVLFLVTPLGHISDQYGIRWGVAATVPFWLAAGAVLWSARGGVGRDASAVLGPSGPGGGGASVQGAEPDALLSCQSVDVAYGNVQVLFGVDLDVREGEILALLGTNGAGKSTLLRAISRLAGCSGGAIVFGREDITHSGARKAAQAGIVQMPGGRAVFPTLSVRNCLRLAGWMYRHRDREHVRRATEEMLERFPVLRLRLDQPARHLSGGEQQMLGLAMSLIAKPRLLLIDELSLGLAPAVVGDLVEVVKEIHARGTTIILVEQSVNLALTMAERAIFLEKGRVRFEGRTVDLLARDDILRSVFLDHGAPSAGGKSAVSSNGLPAASKVAEPASRHPALELQHLCVNFGGIRAVNDVSFRVDRNEIVGLIGPNGAGKTTLLDLISGFTRPTEGKILLGGVDVTANSPSRRAWLGLGRSFQSALLFPSLTVAENVAVALERHLPSRDALSTALCLPAVAEEEHLVAVRTRELLELLGLMVYAETFARDLSTGTRRVVDLAMAIAHRPSVLLLDEPAAGLAQRETEALGPLLQRVRDEVGCSILIIEHDVPFLKRTADRLGALDLGRLVTIGLPEETVEHPQVVAAYLGTNAAAVARSGATPNMPSPAVARRSRTARAVTGGAAR
jgi:branched-chain amino acid transport system ATP-binding protein